MSPDNPDVAAAHKSKILARKMQRQAAAQAPVIALAELTQINQYRRKSNRDPLVSLWH
jgi:hypothetical protein